MNNEQNTETDSREYAKRPVEQFVMRFNVGAVWQSPRGYYYRVVETNEETGQAVLRLGLRGNTRKIRRGITSTKNWIFIAPSVTDKLLTEY